MSAAARGRRRATWLALGVLVLAPCRASSQPEAAAAPAPAPAADVAAFTEPDYTLGRADAPVTVVEYMSTTCSHCAAFHRDVWDEAKRRLIETGRVRWIVREAPTAPVAVAAAGFIIARCTGREHYLATVLTLLKEQPRILAAADIKAAVRIEAEAAGLSASDAAYCLSDPDLIAGSDARRRRAIDEGVDGTPFFVVNGRALRPGERLAGLRYAGGELSWPQLADAVRITERPVGPDKPAG